MGNLRRIDTPWIVAANGHAPEAETIARLAHALHAAGLAANRRGLWWYSEASGRFHKTKDGADLLGGRAGDFVGRATVRGFRNALSDDFGIQVTRLVSELAEQRISIGEWENQMRGRLRSLYIQQYLLGRGGRGQMTQQDWGRVGGLLGRQYEYLRGFTGRIMNGKHSEAQAQLIARMYTRSSVRAFEAARAEAQDVTGRLPAIPGDGSTVCLVMCRCHWRIVKRDMEILAYWELGVAEHCEDCLERARKWYPLRIPFP